MARLEIPPLAQRSAPAAGAGESAPPSVETIAIVFGVADGPDAVPSADSFFEVYRITLPVFALVALDPDGVHEFDATGLFESLAGRATRRRWGVRVELCAIQPAASAGRDALWIEAPESAGPLAALDAPGTVLPGGNRRVTVASKVATTVDAVAALAGTYRLGAGERAGRPVTLALDRYEFQP